MRKIICPECGAEFVPGKEEFNSGKWAAHEDAEITSLYNSGSPILEISERLNRSPDAVRNRLYILRNSGRRVNISVSVSATEFDEMREAYKESQAHKLRGCESCVSRYICPYAGEGKTCEGFNKKDVFISFLSGSTPGIAWEKKIAFIEKQQKEAADNE